MSEFVHYVILDVPNITQNSSFVGLFRSLTGLELSFDVHEFNEGGNNDFVRRLPGRMRYPNLVLAWGMVNDESLLKWFWQTHNQAQLQDITLTLSASKGDVTNTIRKFVFADAFPVRWSGPTISGDGISGEWGETLEIAHSGLKMT